jgi:SAM-dependent methyltransferase
MSEASPPSSPVAASAIPAAVIEDDVGGLLPASHWSGIPIPVRISYDSDTDSALGSDLGSFNTSIASSIREYRTINGRTYHAPHGNAEYWGANDKQQLESMDLLAHLCYLVNGRKLYNAPLQKETVRNTLDIGTGTGVWAMDFAEEFPDCEVVGTDISPIQPEWAPRNCSFEIEDCTQLWTFEDDYFDYVHIRILFGSIPDWDALFAEAYRVTKPGGWIESHETSPELYCDDGSIPADSAMSQWGKFFLDGGKKNGRSFHILHDDVQARGIELAGFRDIQVINREAPIGAWPKDPDLNEMGRICQAALEQDPEGYVNLMAGIARGWTNEEVAAYCAHLRAELRNIDYHGYTKFRCVIGRKPL